MSDTVQMPRPEETGADYFDLAAALAALRDGRPLAFPPFELVHHARTGLSFCLNMQRDPIQNALRQGRFYEQEELTLLAGMVPPGAHVIDVGANIGNHALYFATQMAAARVVVVEPNPLSLAPLVANVVLNGLQGRIDLSTLGVGLSDRPEGGYGMKRHDRNLGATKMKPGQGTMNVVRGDDLFRAETPHLLKIDVEGMEMRVLAGLAETVERARPVILIEVDDQNAAAFTDWCRDARYSLVRRLREEEKNANYVVQPAERDAA